MVQRQNRDRVTDILAVQFFWDTLYFGVAIHVSNCFTTAKEFLAGGTNKGSGNVFNT